MYGFKSRGGGRTEWKKKNKQNHCVGGADTQEKMKKKKVSPGN